MKPLVLRPKLALASLLVGVVASGTSCDPPPVKAIGGPPPPEQQVDDGDAGFGWMRPPPDGTPAAGTTRPSTPTPTRTARDGAPEPPDNRTPSGFLLLSKERLDWLRSKGQFNPAIDRLRENVDNVGSSLDHSNSGPENAALMYLLTGQKRYADLAWRWFKSLSKENVRRDSYLGFGELMRGSASILNWCAAALTPAQQTEIAEYLEKWTNELWFANKGSGWGLKDPGNNYFYSFVEGSAFAAYALKAAKRPSAQKLVDLVHSKIEGPGGALGYLDKGGRGGDWEEGSNYGLGSKRHMFIAFAAIASMGGPNYFARTPFTNASLVYAAYQIQPGRHVLAPMGDIAREPTLSVSAFDREYVQPATYWSDDPTARGLGGWILTEVAPSFVSDTASLRWLFHRDVLFPTPRPVVRPDKLPLHYHSPGTDWINARSGWDDGATSLTFNATPVIEQSHAHFDTGAFLLYRNGWQAVDGASYGHSGLNWDSGAHNMITVKGQVRHGERSRGLVAYEDDDKLMYASIEAPSLFTVKPGGVGEPVTVLDEWTRELVYVRPSTLVVYDRVVPKPLGKDYSWRLHFAKKPAGSNGAYSSTNGNGSIGVVVLDGGPQSVVQDKDVVDDGTSWRLELAPNPTGRFLAVVQVGASAPPNVSAEPVTGAGVQGAAFADQAVVFSSQPRGQPVALPFSFTFKDPNAGRPLQFTLVDMKASVNATVSRAGSMVTVRVSAGRQYTPDAQGVVRFSP